MSLLKRRAGVREERDCIAETNEIPPRENIEAFNLNDKKEGARDDEELSALKSAGQF